MTRHTLHHSLIVLIILALFGCGSSDDSTDSNNGITKLSFDAVPGEAVRLGDLMFPGQAEALGVQIDEQWGEINDLYDALATITLPDGVTPENVCTSPDEFDNSLDSFSLPVLALDPVTEAQLSLLCEQLNTALGEVNNLQEAVNFAADYLWQSNNESVALVNGNGLALVTNEGVATITVTDAQGTPTHEITINASALVQKVNQLAIQNDKVVTIEAGTIKTLDSSGTVSNELPIVIDSYDAASGLLQVSAAGAGALAVSQTLIIAPGAEFEEGAIFQVDAISDLGGGVIAATVGEGNLASVMQGLDMEQKAGVSADTAATTASDTDIEGVTASKASLSGGVILAEGVSLLSPEEYRKALLESDKGQAALKALNAGVSYSEMSDEMMIMAASISGDWNPGFAFSFDVSDSQDNETDGWGSMGLKGTLGFSMPIHMYLRYSDWELKRFIAYFKPTQNADIEISVTGDADIERTIAEVRGSLITFYIGPVPVYMRPIFEVSVGGRAVGDNVTVKVVDYEVWTKYGVDYWRNRSGRDWRPIAHYDRSFREVGWTGGDIYLSAWGQVEPLLRFWGMGGPYGRAQIGARLKADTSLTAPGDNWAELGSYVHVSTGVKLDISVEGFGLDVSVVDYDRSFGRVLDLHREEWSSGGPYAP